MKIFTLIENTKKDEKYECEHGLSYYIESPDDKILFDTGKSKEFIWNSLKMGINLSLVEKVVISHGHYDHTGGLLDFYDFFNFKPELFLSKNYFRKKYKLDDNGNFKYIGSKFSLIDLMNRNIEYFQVENDIIPIAENLSIYTNFFKVTEYEKVNERFKVEDDFGMVSIDHFTNELSIVIDSDEGLVIIVGCSHIGLVNIVETIRSRSGKKILGIIGGSHLISCKKTRIENTIEYLKELDLKFLALSHCTGEEVKKMIKSELGEIFIDNYTGSVIDLNSL